MKFVMQRNRTIASTSGHAVQFVKGEPTYVPPPMYAEVMAAGAIPEEEIDLDPPQAGASVEPTDPITRRKAVFDAFEKILLRAQREDFAASGAPHAKAASLLLGWTLGNKERDTLWTEFRLRNKE